MFEDRSHALHSSISDWPAIGEIGMPENTGGDRAPGGPGSGHARELFRVGKATAALDLLCGSGQSQITQRQDVGPAKGQKAITVSGPWPATGMLQTEGTDGLYAQ